MAASLASSFAEEALPPTLPSASEQPPLHDGTTRLYMSYACPYAQRAWIARNCKGLQGKITLVPIDLADKPAWYKKIYPKNAIPSLEHNNKVVGESLDLIKYMDSNFQGPKLFPDDPEKQRFAEELLAYSDTFNQAMLASLTAKGGVTTEAVAALDKIEVSLSKFDDGPFFLGQFSLVDIAYAPFVDGFQVFFAGIQVAGRGDAAVRLAAWRLPIAMEEQGEVGCRCGRRCGIPRCSSPGHGCVQSAARKPGRRPRKWLRWVVLASTAGMAIVAA